MRFPIALFLGLALALAGACKAAAPETAVAEAQALPEIRYFVIGAA